LLATVKQSLFVAADYELCHNLRRDDPIDPNSVVLYIVIRYVCCLDTKNEGLRRVWRGRFEPKKAGRLDDRRIPPEIRKYTPSMLPKTLGPLFRPRRTLVGCRGAAHRI
jgi:hypothetical protein